MYHSECSLSSRLESSLTQGSELRISDPGSVYHFGLTVSEIENIPGVEVRVDEDGEPYTIVPESLFDREGDLL